MKLLKAGLAVILACVLLTGCGKKDLTEDEMKALFQEAQTSMTSLESSHIALDAKLNMSGDLLAQSNIKNTDMTMTLDMKYKDMNQKTMELAGEYGIGVMGVNMTGNIYIKDETMYMDFLGQKMKTPVDLTISSIVQQPVNADLSMLNNWSYANEDGLDIISCDINKDYFQNILSQLEDEQGAFKVNKISCKYGINDHKYISSIVIDLDVEMSLEGSSVAYVGQINMIWDEHNKISEISFPDLSDYPETEDSSLDSESILAS